ncbi:MAG: GGDEF domain-containing protein [Sulfurimonas sp.]|nr:GGDEF domain-containing protein [Sulfurimonas sp.]
MKHCYPRFLKKHKHSKKEIENLKEAVYKDELTHAYNRKWMNDRFIDANDNFNLDGTLAIIDLNFFKLVNDTHGHITGDKVLTFVATQLKKTKQSLIRYGGDEFIIIFKDTDQDTAFASINTIRESIISKKLKTGDASFRVSFSIGTYEFEEGDSLSSTIELADKNMYNDKVKIKTRITGID